MISPCLTVGGHRRQDPYTVRQLRNIGQRGIERLLLTMFALKAQAGCMPSTIRAGRKKTSAATLGSCFPRASNGNPEMILIRRRAHRSRCADPMQGWCGAIANLDIRYREFVMWAPHGIAAANPMVTRWNITGSGCPRHSLTCVQRPRRGSSGRSRRSQPDLSRRRGSSLRPLYGNDSPRRARRSRRRLRKEKVFSVFSVNSVVNPYSTWPKR